MHSLFNYNNLLLYCRWKYKWAFNTNIQPFKPHHHGDLEQYGATSMERKREWCSTLQCILLSFWLFVLLPPTKCRHYSNQQHLSNR